MLLVVPTALIAAACTLMAHGALPDSRCTPGAIQSTNTRAVCSPGWATKHRHVTANTRAEVFGATGSRIVIRSLNGRLTIGFRSNSGAAIRSPTCGRNTIRRQRTGSKTPSMSECAPGAMKLTRAQRIFEHDWRAYESGGAAT